MGRRGIMIPSLTCVLLLTITSALSPPRRLTLLLPVSKDRATNQYVTRIQQKTPSSLLNLVVDLGARYSWVDCDRNYNSSTLSYVPCNSSDCKAALSKACSVPSNICGTLPGNPYIRTSGPGDLAEDSVTIRTTDGFNPRRAVNVPKVTFSCAGSSLLKGLVPGASGMAGFGRTGVALPSQLSSSLGYLNKFTLCLPTAGGSDGVIFFGDGPYHFLLNGEFSDASFAYTPLLVNPVSTALSYFAGERSVEYFIKVTSIKVGGKIVPINSSLLSISKKGKGGTKLSTVDPYTVLESSIYKAVVDAFARESGLKRLKPVAPFGACFDGRRVVGSRAGAQVPTIELVFGTGKASSWVWYGANTMVDVRPGVLCLGLVDGGADVTTSIVVGGYQMDDNLLMFDLAGQRFGVTGTIRFLQTTCSDFNFTVAP